MIKTINDNSEPAEVISVIDNLTNLEDLYILKGKLKDPDYQKMLETAELNLTIKEVESDFSPDMVLKDFNSIKKDFNEKKLTPIDKFFIIENNELISTEEKEELLKLISNDSEKELNKDINLESEDIQTLIVEIKRKLNELEQKIVKSNKVKA